MTRSSNNPSSSLNLSLLSVGMGAVLIAQFLSALADNAILIAAIAIVKSQGLAHLVPVLQGTFVLPFILLAPFVGQIADAFPKGRVMLIANLLKLSGALAMAAGLNPLVAYCIIGVSAALYSPAKYGILAQLFSSEKLVKANGMIEGSTIFAILLGVLVGGWLADVSLTWAFIGVIACYTLAAIANWFIPKLPAENSRAQLRPWFLLCQFARAVKILFGDRDARFSLLGTSFFWGSGITLRLMLYAWVPATLLINDNQTPANLMGVVSVGIVIGAALAGAFISLKHVNRALWGGLLLGPLIIFMAGISTITTSVMVMAGIGLCGGLFIVPLNALLQERGHHSIGAGNALAVQNFSENSFMLLFVGAYSLALAAGGAITTIIVGFGLVLLIAIATIAILRWCRG